jgi:hypothetical protein
MKMVGDVFDPQRLQIAGGERRARGRDVLKGALLLAGDEDLFDFAVLLAQTLSGEFLGPVGIGFVEVRRIGGWVYLDRILGRGGNRP